MWQLILLYPHWRRLSQRAFWTSLPLLLTSFVILVGFFAAGILVAEVTRTTGTDVLVRSQNCGNWTFPTVDSTYEFISKTLNDTITAANYARTCYGGSFDAFQCNRYQTRSLPYTKQHNVTCPFKDGMCFDRYPAFSLDTENLSPHDHFGINAKPQERIYYRRKSVCAPVLLLGYNTQVNYTDDMAASMGTIYGQDGDVIDLYNDGGGSSSRAVHHRTLLLPIIDILLLLDMDMIWSKSHNQVPTKVKTDQHSAFDSTGGDGDSNLWYPVDTLMRKDGDLSLMFLSANNLLYYGAVEDPIFLATKFIGSVMEDGKNNTFYTSNYWVNVLGCVDQRQFCNPTNHACTKLDSYSSAVRAAQADLQLNAMQYVTVSTM